MAARDRLRTIKQIIIAEKKVIVSELSQKFDVTEETIRRDLEKLESEGVLTRTYGGAVLSAETQVEGIHFYKRASCFQDEKKMIAKETVKILKNHTAIAADASSTVMETIKLLPNSSDITLLTNSTEVFMEMAQSKMDIISTGGLFNRRSLALQGTIAQQSLENYHVDILLMSCKGLDMYKGAMDSNEGEAEIKKLLVKQAEEVALLVDSSKFDKSALVKLIDLKDLDYIITNVKPEDKWIEFCDKHNIKLIY